MLSPYLHILECKNFVLLITRRTDMIVAGQQKLISAPCNESVGQDLENVYKLNLEPANYLDSNV